jgi:hypothetical protein
MIRYLFLLSFIAIASGKVLADSQVPLLFESDSVMYLTLPVNFDTLCRPSESPDCDYTHGIDLPQCRGTGSIGMRRIKWHCFNT